MSAIQFRRYELKAGAHDEFIAWYRQIVPIRERCGFRLIFAFDLEEVGEFISAWRYEGDIAKVERRYYRNPERQRLGAVAQGWALANRGTRSDAELEAHPGFTRETHVTTARVAW